MIKLNILISACMPYFTWRCPYAVAYLGFGKGRPTQGSLGMEFPQRGLSHPRNLVILRYFKAFEALELVRKHLINIQNLVYRYRLLDCRDEVSRWMSRSRDVIFKCLGLVLSRHFWSNVSSRLVSSWPVFKCLGLVNFGWTSCLGLGTSTSRAQVRNCLN